jgi:hypothetical protein
MVTTSRAMAARTSAAPFPRPASRRVALLLSLLVTVAVPALVAGTAGSAHAASRTVADATQDVYALTPDAPTKVPGPDGDIVSVTTVHTAHSVRIKIRARHLSLAQTVLMAKIRTGPTGPAYFFNGTADIGMRMAVMTHGQASVVVCPGLWMRFRPQHGYVTAVVPRRCLGDPRWVRTGAALVTSDSLIASLADDDFDPFGEGSQEPSGTVDVAGIGDLTAAQMNASVPPFPLGPRVHVG